MPVRIQPRCKVSVPTPPPKAKASAGSAKTRRTESALALCLEPLFTQTPIQPQLLRRQQVEEMTGLKRSSIYARINPNCKQYDPDFPKPISLSTGAKGGVAWIASEVVAWIETRIAASRGIAPGNT